MKVVDGKGEEKECDRFYRAAMELLQRANVSFLVGGAYAFGVYTGIKRDTKDFDLLIRADDVDRALKAFATAGYSGERTFPHWLAKVKCGEDYIDLIYRSGNGISQVDDSWFAGARDAELVGFPVKLCRAEDMLWMKAFVMERERYDGADVAHLIDSCADAIDWKHLIRRFGPDWRLLLSHLVLFGYIFPGEAGRIPAWVMNCLLERLRNEPKSTERICRGTLISREQYLRDVEERGFVDARTEQRVHMNGEDIARWTDAIARDGSGGR